jgi:hypothetical protein
VTGLIADSKLKRRQRLQGCARGMIVALLAVFGTAPLAASPPSLIVLVVSEQFRSDYLQLYEKDFSAAGFGRLLTDGAVFPTARYEHLTTLAGPNAATLATGAYPALHGIVADRWYERGEDRVVRGVDSLTRVPFESPDRLTGSTFADELRLATRGQSRVFAVSGRAEGAVLQAGRRPIGAYWMSADGTFGTSRYYRPTVPGWVDGFNGLHGAARSQGKQWRGLGQADDGPPLRVMESGEGLPALYRSSPFAAADTLAFALQAVESEGLGQGDYPDLLIVNISAPAYLALETGAHSPLMRDMVLRLDRMLGAFFDDLERRLGLDNVGIIFTATHGIGPLPEGLRDNGLAAGRVPSQGVVEAINAALAGAYGQSAFVQKFVYPYVYLSDTSWQAAAGQRTAVLRTAGEAARTVPGVAGFYAPEPGLDDVPGDGSVRNSWYPKRAGDLALIYDPYFSEDFGGGRGTAPGSFYRYDTDVPLIFHGPGFRGGQYNSIVSAVDIAPTLCVWLGISSPTLATGEVLADALLPRKRPEFIERNLVGPVPPAP